MTDFHWDEAKKIFFLNPWKFCKKILRIRGVQNLSFFRVGHFICFYFISMKNNQHVYRIARMGRNFDDYPGPAQNNTCLKICNTVYMQWGRTFLLQVYVHWLMLQWFGDTLVHGSDCLFHLAPSVWYLSYVVFMDICKGQ